MENVKKSDRNFEVNGAGIYHFAALARLLMSALCLSLILMIQPFETLAQQTATPLNPQAPGGPQDAGGPIIIGEGQTLSTASGAQSQTIFTVLYRTATDPEHATDPQTGRNFHWDPDSKSWVNSATGKSYVFAGYLSSTSGQTSAAQQTATPLNPQAPGGPQDAGRPVVIGEGQTLATATGAQTQTFFTVLYRTPADPEHATDPQLGRNFHWDPDTKMWVNSATGQGYGFSGYLSSTSGPVGTGAENKTVKPDTPSQPASKKPVSLPLSLYHMQSYYRLLEFEHEIRLAGFRGASFISGNAPPTAGFDGAVLFPLGNRILIGPTAGFQWVDASIVKTIGGGPPPSTFMHTIVGFKDGNFGLRVAFPLGGFELGIQGGVTVAGSTITQNEGFTGNGTPSGGPAGATVTSSTTTHDTVVGPFAGGYVSHSIFSHVGVFVEYDYRRLKDTKPNPTNPSGPSVSVFDLHSNDVTAGLVLSFGRHKGK